MFQRTLKSTLLASSILTSPMVSYSQEAQQADQDQIDTIVTVGRYIPDEKRATSEISNVVSSSDFSLAGDSDIAVALTRLPGISPDVSGKYVVIRGLNERYTSTLLNGIELPSPDPLKRAVPLDIFPTSLVGNVLIQKTYSAEFPGAFGGGVIDIRTKVVPDESFFEIGFATGYNSASTFKDGLTYYGSDTDVFGFDDGTRDMPDIIAQNPTLEGLSAEQLEQAGEAFPNVWSIDFQSNAPDFDFNAAGGTNFDVGDEGELGVIFAVDYGSKFRNKFGQRSSYSASSATESGLEADRDFSPRACEANGVPGSECGYDVTTWDIDLNTFASVGWQINPEHAIKYTSLLLRSTQKQVEIQQGSTNSEDLANFTRLDWVERQVWSHTLDGEHAFYLFDDDETELFWYANTTKAKRDVPNRRSYIYVYDNNADQFEMLRRNDSNRIEYGNLEDTSKDIGFDVKQPFYIDSAALDFKFGASYNEKNRVSDYKKYGFNLSNVTNDDLRTFVPEVIFGSVNIDPNGIFLDEFFDPSSAFTADFENKQFFAQVDAQVTDQVRVSAGMRYEDSLQTVQSTNRTTFEDIRINQDLQKWLPSATVTWEFIENMQIRLAYSETVNRPDSRELAPVFFVREDGRTERGNENLIPADIRSLDARFEWYFDTGQSLTIGAFYKEIENPIEQSIFARGDGEADTVANAESAKLKGGEIEVEKILATIGAREFFVKANASYIDSEVIRSRENFDQVTNLVGRLQGQSDYLANLQVGFENLDIGEKLNIIVNYQGDRIYRLGTTNRPDLIEDIPVQVNFLYSRDFELFGDNPITMTFKAQNLLNEKALRTQGSEIAESFEIGRTFSLGFNYTF